MKRAVIRGPLNHVCPRMARSRVMIAANLAMTRPCADPGVVGDRTSLRLPYARHVNKVAQLVVVHDTVVRPSSVFHHLQDRLELTVGHFET